MPLVRVRILADDESRPGLRALVDAAFPTGDWRYPDYCYIEVGDLGAAAPISVPAAPTLGAALSRLRASVRRGARGVIVSSRSAEAALRVAHRLPGMVWQSAVRGPGSDRMSLRLFGLQTG